MVPLVRHTVYHNTVRHRTVHYRTVHHRTVRHKRYRITKRYVSEWYCYKTVKCYKTVHYRKLFFPRIMCVKIVYPCKTNESHAPHKLQSSPMTNVLSPNIIKIRVLYFSDFGIDTPSLCLLCFSRVKYDSVSW